MATLNNSHLYQGVNIALHGKFLKLYTITILMIKKEKYNEKSEVVFRSPRRRSKAVNSSPLWDRNCPQKISIETRPGFDSP